MAQNNADRLSSLLNMREELEHGKASIEHIEHAGPSVSAPAAKANAPRPS